MHDTHNPHDTQDPHNSHHSQNSSNPDKRVTPGGGSPGLERPVQQPQPRPVRLLREQVARKIAAGEVIDRPFSVVRELIDNSLDAGATAIEVRIKDGGRSRIQVTDNGHGMDTEDLDLCYRPHATSKIESEDDLERVSSLGFRGEALASIATVSRMEVRSARRGSDTAHRIGVHAGSLIYSEVCQGAEGTSVTVEDLFYSLPARRKFLKRAASETGMCRSVLVDKAAAFPEVTFRFFVDGELRLFLPPSAPAERVVACFPELGDRALLSLLKGSGDGFTLQAITAGTAMLRRDRKLLQVFVNRRRVWEYSLVHAMQHAYEPVAPGGTYPVCFLFVQCNPELVDFNIHPAKREVRFRNLPEIHHRTVETISSYLRADLLKRSGQTSFSDSAGGTFTGAPGGPGGPGGSTDLNGPIGRTGPPGSPVPPPPRYTQSDLLQPLRRSSGDLWRAATVGEPETPDALAESDGLRYVGQVFDVFLLASRGDRLYIVDQHAGHERILYDRFRAETALQELLVPVVFEVSEEEERTLRSRQQEITELGVKLERNAPGSWVITAASSAFLSHQDELVETLREVTRHPQEISRRFFAQMACKAAVKQGDRLEGQGAVTLLQQIFALPEPRCPHGRPLWAEVSREQLYALVGRT